MHGRAWPGIAAASLTNALLIPVVHLTVTMLWIAAKHYVQLRIHPTLIK
jgi:hypothetical protein